MDASYEIGIVGAGPIGGYIASKLADHVDSIAKRLCEPTLRQRFTMVTK